MEEMIRDGIIEPSSSPWAPHYSLPQIDERLDALSGASLFSTFGLANGYWQEGKTKEVKSAFVTKGGNYQLKAMPFGLCGAPPTFERLKEKVLG